MKTRIKNFFPSLTLSSPFLTSVFPLLLTFLTLLFVTAAQAQVPSYVPTNGLVGYWPFNGNANDESGNGNNGTVNGATLTTDRFGDSNKAYFFSGINCDPRIDANVNTSSINSSNEYSISIWINKNGDGCMSQPRILEFYSTTNGALQFNWDVANGVQNSFMVETINSSGLYQSVSFIYSDWLNNWNNIVFTAKNGEANLFLNGELMNAFVFQGLPSLSGDVNFGRMNHPSFNSMNGNLDDIALWDRSLTAGEVLSLYNGCNVIPQVVAGNTTPGAFANSTYTCNNNAGSTYTWTVNNGVIVSGQGTNSVTILWGAEGVGSVTVTETTADGCVGDEVIYDVNVQCVVSGNEITGPVGPEAFSNSTYTCNGAVNSTYNWTVTNGVIASGQGTNTVNILWASTGLGNVSVVETTAEGCVGTNLSQDVVVIPTNVEELSNAMILYPNPVTTNLTLQVKSEMIGSDFVVFDALGNVVLRDKILSSNQNISVINLSNGNYILRVGAMNKAFTISK